MANSLDFYSTLHRPQNLRMRTHTVYTCGSVSPAHITYEPDAVFILSCSLEYTQRSCAHVIVTCHSAFCNSVQFMTVSVFNSTKVFMGVCYRALLWYQHGVCPQLRRKLWVRHWALCPVVIGRAGPPYLDIRCKLFLI